MLSHSYSINFDTFNAEQFPGSLKKCLHLICKMRAISSVHILMFDTFLGSILFFSNSLSSERNKVFQPVLCLMPKFVTLQHRHALSVYPHFVGLLFIHIFTLLFFLIEYSTFTDQLLSEHVAGYCTSVNALTLGAIFLFCFRISVWLIVLNPIAATY